DAAGGDPAKDPVDDPDHADDDQERRVERVAEDQPQHADEHGEQEQEPERPPAVRADLLLERHFASSKATTGASRPSSVPKNSRSRKPNGFAISAVGKVCIVLWYAYTVWL